MSEKTQTVSIRLWLLCIVLISYKLRKADDTYMKCSDIEKQLELFIPKGLAQTDKK